jgi:hypothetical protein
MLLFQLCGLLQHYIEEISNLLLASLFDVSDFVLDLCDELCLCPENFDSKAPTPTIVILRAQCGQLLTAYGLELHYSFKTRTAYVVTRYQPLVPLNWLERRILRQAFLEWLDMAVTSTSYALEEHF